MNPSLSRLRGEALHWAQKSMVLSFDREDKPDEETLNRILWHAIHGDSVPFPSGGLCAVTGNR